ncbi:hypothetical protein [Brenneria salicis]|uniref:hypothetical protein n=1 Tax=Brenneria salicis TaxID=55214 RepID=UPI000F20B169|nr:hypothetical protein [Brenneria salicis]RLM30129.1 hypothetical protein BHG07_12200 [Brenneria salicis ATCC 15712 = DSM 30166]
MANLLHARDVPILKSAVGDVAMDALQVADAEAGIKKFIPAFNYTSVLGVIKDKAEMKRRFTTATVGYDKIHFSVFIRKYTVPPMGSRIASSKNS